MNKALKILQERGFIQQCTDLKALSDRMDKGQIAFYTGTDPTGPSLHIGHMVPIFALKHLCREGHKGVVLVGGGTSRIGDPSGKTEMRKMLSYDELDKNATSIQNQIEKFLAEDIKNVRFVNNKDWLADLNYIDFLRDIGSHFSVNKMLSFEAYKKRMETGLSFLEFNYQLLQSYDFLMLNQNYNVELQIGGDDQWGNMVAGSDLIRRKGGGEVFALTFPLVTRADGQKMGKSEKGALFLDPTLVSPYDFFQYWRNTADADVEKFMLLFTFLSIEEIKAACAGDINKAKERLAFEVTALIHGKEEAEKALEGARAAFSGGGNKDAMPTANLSLSKLNEGIGIIDLFAEAGLASTKSDARRLVEQGGAFINEEKISDIKAIIGKEKLDKDNEMILRAGKKRFMRIIFS
ncbi:tyrosine--tRNA ligase [Treponema denticola]|jgi:tyrosine--tRNA ligase|uniref:Tyrosine--tRNA ligase n=1 Tax=Treponema denticola H1-T TaxID=999431 RepID=M2AXU2_TREDN|nr:tyrosine--tRNA ligase [Treponema denticola]EMB27542.1 tyrosyl-tRNA synthetase [Treponema denticola MYR-T]EMB28181.1 tyrosyl-tRNA synthetase [Treponema denticola H1-T]UTC85733.1 tyrosine--tRNA ligase [Treponema denticola]